MAVTLADGSVYPHLGQIDFSEPSFSQETGTFLVRTLFANPDSELRPGQFVRVRLRGAMRPNSILLPQRAVLQGAKGHYVWIVDGEGKAARREVEIGDWQGEGWFINQGLLPGEGWSWMARSGFLPESSLKSLIIRSDECCNRRST